MADTTRLTASSDLSMSVERAFVDRSAVTYRNGVTVDYHNTDATVAVRDGDGKPVWSGTWTDWENLLALLPRLALFDLCRRRLRDAFDDLDDPQTDAMLLAAVDRFVDREAGA